MQDPNAPAARSVADIATKQAARYLTQLCKHFEHKLPVTYSAATGTLPFPMGTCRLSAQDGTLTLTAEAGSAAALAQLQDVVARHLLRFAFREDLHVAWRAG